MQDWLPRITIIGALLVVLGVPFLFRPAVDGTDAQLRDRLVIYSPHNEQIRFEYARAFNAWRVSQGRDPIFFDWRSGGGTSDLRKSVEAEFLSRARRGREDDGIGADLFFGGGEYEHNVLARGVEIERGNEKVRISLTIPADVSDELIAAAFPENDIGGERLYSPDKRWIGGALSSFGIVYNRDVLAMLDLPEPQTWADLADPRYLGWVALADPGHSGSIAATYNTIIRRMGWDDGWHLLRRVFANSRYFTASAGKVPVDVSAGEAAAGMCIDFFGRYQSGAIGGNRVGYIDPAFMTAVTADPISILRGAPNEAIAHEFVRWLITPHAQRLWQARLGEPQGPDRFELRRLPIRRDMYQPDEMKHWVDDVDPWRITRPMPTGMPDFYRSVGIVSHAMAINVHRELQAAWRAIVENIDHPRHAAMLERFDAMPDLLTIPWPDPTLEREWMRILDDVEDSRHPVVVQTLRDFRTGLVDRWRNPETYVRDSIELTQFFQHNYREVVRMSRTSGD